jgi:formate hydrogenlyase subunit 3/multisubunit Na+/H+ antiporter MnhD subunit
MFMAAGLIAEAVGHDRIAELGGVGRALPVACIAFGLAGLSLMGVPPSGGFVAKSMLLLAAVRDGQWWWAAVILAGGLLAGGYVLVVLGKALSGDGPPPACMPVSRGRELVTLGVALCAVLLGLVPLQPSEYLQIGRPALEVGSR